MSLDDFKGVVSNLHNDVKQCYWELAFAWRNLETANTALNSARRTWQKVYALHRTDSRGGEAQAEAQAREQFYQFKRQAQTLVDELLRAESRLRYAMGLSATDGRLIRPSDRPTVAKVSFDWHKITEEALTRNPDLHRQRVRIKQRELELTAAKNLLQPRLDASEILDGGQFQEWQLSFQSTMPIGVRKELAQLRHFQLQLARERAKLQDEELEVSHQLADALRQLVLSYELTQTNSQRALAADRQVEALQAAFETETVTIDQLLEAQRRRAEAQTSYFRTLLDYQRAILTVHYRKGSLL